MIWLVLVMLLACWSAVIFVGRLWGTAGVLVLVTLVLLAISVLVFGGVASLAFSMGLPAVGTVSLAVMIGLIAYLIWNAYVGLWG
jgi:hypothetical protein